jgi:putative phage-type endonuclease
MIIEGLDQQSPEWLAMRVGMCTASRVADAIAKLKRKDGEAAKRRDYKWELVLERLTGLTAEHFVSEPMKWGMDFEPLARKRYAQTIGEMVVPIGFAMHDRIKWFGASPDALVGDEGLLEIKCPTPETHLEYILNGVMPEQYVPQVLAELSCSGRQWADFVSFDPRLPDNLQLFMVRVQRDEAKIAELEADVEQFLAEVKEITDRLKAGGSIEAALKESVKLAKV